MNKIVLTISVLLSDRLDTIRRCLDSLKPLRESVTSELILVVTTDDPGVYALAESYADRVVSFRWCSDFAKARNAGLCLARGEWFLYIDDDECFEDCEELIRFFRSGEYRNYAFANYIQRNYQDKGMHFYSDTPVTRMVRRDPDIRFRSRIHEYFYPVHGACKNLSAIALHTGYIQHDENARMTRFRRNAPLLMEMMEEEPENPRWKIQLLQEYREVELWAWEYQLGKSCMEEMKSIEDSDEDYYCACSGAVVESLTELRRGKEALTAIERALADPRSSRLTRAFLYLEMGLNLLREGMPDEAEAAIEAYEAICEALEKKPEELTEESGKVIVGEAAGSLSRIKAEQVRLCCRLLRGDTGYFDMALPMLGWDQPSIYILEDLIPVWVKAMSMNKTDKQSGPEKEREAGEGSLEPDRETEERDSLDKALALAWKNNTLRDKLVEESRKWENEALLMRFACLSEEHWYVWYARLLTIARRSARGKDGECSLSNELETDAVGYCSTCKNLFLIPHNLFLLPYLDGIDPEWRDDTEDNFKSPTRTGTSQRDLDETEVKYKNPDHRGTSSREVNETKVKYKNPDRRGAGSQEVNETKVKYKNPDRRGAGSQDVNETKVKYKNPDRRGAGSQDGEETEGNFKKTDQEDVNARKFLIAGKIWKKFQDQVPFEKWTKDLSEFIESTDFGADSESGPDVEECEELMQRFARIGTACAEYLYSGEALRQESAFIPGEIHAAVALHQLFALKEDAQSEKVALLKKALHAWPALAPLIRIYAGRMTAGSDSRKSEVKEDGRERSVEPVDEKMLQIARQVIAQVRVLLEKGLVEEAMDTVHQLRSMMPENEEIRQLEEEISQIGGSCWP